MVRLREENLIKQKLRSNYNTFFPIFPLQELMPFVV